MLEIGICDDDHLLLAEMESRLYELGGKSEVKVKVESYTDGEEIVEAVYGGKRFDIIYMDVEMKNIDGLIAARKIREVDRSVHIIYVTSYDSYMKEAFQAAPIGFIVKPINEKEFIETFHHILKLIGKNDKYYRFRYDRSDYKISLKNVIYFESKRRVTEILCEDGSYKLYKNLETIQKELKEQNVRFVRIHKSYLVNYWYIARFSSYNVELMNGNHLPVSRSRRKEVEDSLCEIMEWCQI